MGTRRTSDDEVRDEAERNVLGACLMTERAIEAATEVPLTSGNFHRPANGIIYATLVGMWAAGRQVDATTVAAELARSGDLRRIGGASYLHTLISSVPSAANVVHYARIVVDRWQGRYTDELGTQLQQAAGIDDPGQRAERIAQVAAELEALLHPRAGGPGQGANSWRPVDLGPFLRGEVPKAVPTLGLTRRDGLRLIYPGKEHSVIGEMESGKSWLIVACVVAELHAGQSVVYIHYEEADPTDTVDRVRALGVPDDQVLALLRFVGPEQPVSPQVLARLLDPAPSLVVHDGVNEAMALHGWAIREEDGAADFRRHLVKPCTSVGAAVLSADHVVKDKESRGRYALGSIHKGNALNGALLVLENAEPFGRGQRGRSHVYVTKDRPGHLRRHGRATKTPGKTYVGELVIDDTRQHVDYLDLAFLAPDPEHRAESEAQPVGVMAKVSELLAAHPGGLSKNAIETMVGGRATIVRTALELLVADGYVAAEQRGTAKIHTLIKDYEGEAAP